MLCCCQNGGESHNGEGNIGDIIEDPPKKTVLDWTPYHNKRENAYCVAGYGHDQKIKIDVMRHMVASSSVQGKRKAVMAAMVMVRKIVRIPPDKVENGGRIVEK